MADTTLTAETWATVTPASQEVWQCKSGRMMITASDPGSASSQGIILDSRDLLGVTIGASVQVWYKKIGHREVVFAREAFS